MTIIAKRPNKGGTRTDQAMVNRSGSWGRALRARPRVPNVIRHVLKRTPQSSITNQRHHRSLRKTLGSPCRPYITIITVPYFCPPHRVGPPTQLPRCGAPAGWSGMLCASAHAGSFLIERSRPWPLCQQRGCGRLWLSRGGGRTATARAKGSGTRQPSHAT